MPVHSFSNSLVNRLLGAVGLEPAETQRVVIVIDPDDVVKVYAVLIPSADDIRRVCEVFETEVLPVAEVVVDEHANVLVKPLEGKKS